MAFVVAGAITPEPHAATFLRFLIQVLMLCGLPGAGKTFFANKHTKDNPEKRFNILGTSYLLTRMKVSCLLHSSYCW